MMKKNKYKSIEQYLQLPWTYTIQKFQEETEIYFVVCVNELPGVCTDAPTIQEAMVEIQDAMVGAFKMYMKHGEEIPEPIDEENYKGKISYRTTSKRHFVLAKEAQRRGLSLSEAIDYCVDNAFNKNR